ncbi:MAG: phosphodiester glycosidase family protein [Clostridia bacterium]|nr:phosphodiester glycosidase family protein [Clostridia bacterium]
MAKKVFKKIGAITALVLSVILLLGSLCGIFLIYGPVEYLRDLWITTAMETFHHQYLATWFFEEEYIDLVVERNKPQVNEEAINLDLIQIGEEEIIPEDVTSSENEEELESEAEVILEQETETGPLITIEDVSRRKFVGYMMVIKDPSLVRVGVTKNLGKRGERLDDMCERLGALAGLNGGGFTDKNGTGNGGYAEGIVMQDGEIIWNSTKGRKHDVVGITYDGKLLLQRMTEAEIKESNLRDCIEFNPFLIVNGVPTKVGVTGIHPRSAIGQTADGTFLFLAIDGRSTRSVGASQADVIEIMLEYGAVNCANLDGGSSSTMIHEGKLINKPSSASDMRSIATAFVVMNPETLNEEE